VQAVVSASAKQASNKYFFIAEIKLK